MKLRKEPDPTSTIKGEMTPSDIELKISSFWVQIHNFPLKSKTKETILEICGKLGMVTDIDIPDTRV